MLLELVAAAVALGYCLRSDETIAHLPFPTVDAGGRRRSTFGHSVTLTFVFILPARRLLKQAVLISYWEVEVWNNEKNDIA
ncbi:hypothetical protein LINPERPRIM_LOCUS38816 [Linum perenne]